VTTFDTANRAERMSFVDALRLLESYGALEVVDGATDAFVDSASAKVLYRIDSTLLLRLLAAPVGPSRLAVPADEVALRFEELLLYVSHERRYGTDAVGISEVQRNLRLRHSIFRRLVDDPVVYLADLSVEERSYLASPTGRQLLRRAAEQGGFTLEERAEGVLFVDVDAVSTDSKFPDDVSTPKVAALLLLDSMDGTATREQLHLAAAELLSRFPRWAKSYRGDDGVKQLVADAVGVLEGFGLVRVEGAMIHPLPAAARYAVRDVRTTEEALP
jgi:uncharacterized protein (TIGR02678 family)